jgi:hypothetical protein
VWILQKEKSEKSEYPQYYYNYKVKIRTTSNSNYKISVPISVELDNQTLPSNITSIENNNISEVMFNLKIKGNGIANMIESPYGQCLQINGNGNVTITSKGYTRIPFSRLNLYEENYGEIHEYNENVDYWIKIEFDIINNNTISLSISNEVAYAHDELSGIGYISDVYIEKLNLEDMNEDWNKYKGIHGIFYI